MPELGEKIRFVPSAWTELCGPNKLADRGTQRNVLGEVVEINRKKRWYRVRYEAGNTEQFECFKF